MLHFYKFQFLLVILCIIITAIATVVGATFPQRLVDDYILPMMASGSTDFSALASDLVRLACVMAIGVVSAFAYNRIMVNVSQGHHAQPPERFVPQNGIAANQVF